uniref:Fork-head domain-containing protein n=1 Tax=Varanus komodoensis TaxID=61221 RepID=A0A8D2J043_VARKO
MDLRLQKPAFWASLHLRSGLRDWDMARELGLGTTCDQLPQGQARGGGGATGAPRGCSGVAFPPAGPQVQPFPWMWVNPNLACPIAGAVSAVGGLLPLAGPQPPPSYLAWGATHLDAAVLEQVEGSQGPTLAPRKAKAFRFRSRKLKRTQGGWPRPPLNYCTLISLALSSSTDSSLTVQEIYQFTRQHFPFFRTAPEGWKNTIRHNLCFSSRFEKTTHFVCLEGNRKSRLWKLTPEGRHKLREEVLALPRDVVGLACQSMDKPGGLLARARKGGQSRLGDPLACGRPSSPSLPPSLLRGPGTLPALRHSPCRPLVRLPLSPELLQSLFGL